MPFWRWAALLSFALVAPAALPAGGAERRMPELRRRQGSAEPLLAAMPLPLHCSPQRQAPVINHVGCGEPFRVLRHWRASSSERWLRVELLASGRRGWLAG